MDENIKNYNAVGKVLVAVLIANLAVTTIKIVLGSITGAMAVVADGFHSLVDSSSNLIGLAAVRLARRPPDEKHPYGYRRYETIGAMVIGGMLLIAAYEIGASIYERMMHSISPNIDALSFWLVAFTLPVNIVVVILEIRASKKLNSEILLADAKHTQTDLYITASVLVSMVAVIFGIAWVDYVVAAFVIIMIVRAAFGILRETTGWLTDRVMVDPAKIEELVYQSPKVHYVHNIRSRGNPGAIYVDLHAKVDPGMSTAQAHAVATEIEHQIVKQLDNVVEAFVHIEPAKMLQPNLWQQLSTDLRMVADGMGVHFHDLYIYVEAGGELTADLHLELPGELNIADAHSIADEFEQSVKERWPQISNLVSHLEPLPEKLIEMGEQPEEEFILKIKTALFKYVTEAQVKSVKFSQTAEHIRAAVVVELPRLSTLNQAHEITNKIEHQLQIEVPELKKVIVHTEPGL